MGPDATWYDAESFKNSATLLREYHNDYPDNAGPPKRLDAWLTAAAEDRIDPPHGDDNVPATANKTRTRVARRR